MRRRKEGATRSEISRRGERHETDLKDKQSELEKKVGDIETVRETSDALRGDGTQDGADEVEVAVEGAKEVSETVFDREDQELDEHQSENEGFQDETTERSDADQEDLDTLSESSARVDTDDTVNELLKAKEALMKDFEWLMDAVDNAKKRGEESEQQQRQYQQRRHARG